MTETIFLNGTSEKSISMHKHILYGIFPDGLQFDASKEFVIRL